MPSFICRNRGSSSIGRPNNSRNTSDGKGVENRAQKSMASSCSKPSISSFTKRLVDSSSRFTCLGANRGRGACGSRGEPVDRSGGDGRTLGLQVVGHLARRVDLWVRSTSSTPAREVTITPTPSTRRIGASARSMAYMACGCRASSGLISSARAKRRSGSFAHGGSVMEPNICSRGRSA